VKSRARGVLYRGHGYTVVATRINRSDLWLTPGAVTTSSVLGFWRQSDHEKCLCVVLMVLASCHPKTKRHAVRCWV